MALEKDIFRTGRLMKPIGDVAIRSWDGTAALYSYDAHLQGWDLVVTSAVRLRFRSLA